MTPSRPYLIRGLYEWIVDNGLTPHLLVNAEGAGVEAPVEYADAGQLVLNVAPAAVRGLDLGNDWVGFSARFGGRPRQVSVPVAEVLAIYARENGRGMLFTPEEGEDDPPPDGDGGGGDTPSGGPADGGKGGPGLRVIK
ncbi:ClpXP protease specificity-enhancing factor [Spiribacter vilamensis]|uniref:Stringent starvation protein B n=1 Tax=Spiribacter vilamensis TaxID=531306 RepID=A0A4Q8CY55_9GAMM|nr:ClpXP protease specificity-enhancing factor [Spiribacter vilamensis]RZU97899.1 stringent starvation protein B [Spiribacter vilamensis]TVO61187.1 ClpXP protease specificity-enhancing factor [Spiribacter vilamensis]